MRAAPVTQRRHFPVPEAISDRGVQCTAQCTGEYPKRYPATLPRQGPSRKEPVLFKPEDAHQTALYAPEDVPQTRPQR
jgi:hypothetical protein